MKILQVTIYFIYFLSFILIAIEDIKKHEIPFILSMTNLILAVIYQYSKGLTAYDIITYAFTPAFMFLFINITYYILTMDFSKDLIGYGDLYLIPSITLMFYSDILCILFFTFLSAIVYDTYRNSSLNKKHQDYNEEYSREVPLAPFLLIGVILSIIINLIGINNLIIGGLVIL